MKNYREVVAILKQQVENAKVREADYQQDMKTAECYYAQAQAVRIESEQFLEDMIKKLGVESSDEAAS